MLDRTVHLACNTAVEIESGWFISCLYSYTKEPILGSQYITVWIAAEGLSLEVSCSSQMRSLGFEVDGQLLTFCFLFNVGVENLRFSASH